jgi:hypothetical protein
MLETRVKQLEKQAHDDFRYIKTLLARLAPFLRKEAAGNLVARVIFIMSYFYV